MDNPTYTNNTSKSLDPNGPGYDAYEDPVFWEAYNNLHHHNPSDTIDFATELAGLLSNRKSPKGEMDVIQILLLGSGCGTIELPLLAELTKHIHNCQFEVHVVDRSKLALKIFQATVFDQKWLGDPIKIILQNLNKHTNEFYKEINSGRFKFKFYQKDLDFDEDKEVGPLPAAWDKDIRETKLDLVISAFTLFHLKYWLPCLSRAISLLDNKGIFLHPRTSGDEDIWERNFVKQPDRTRLADAIFKIIYRKEKAKKFAETPKLNTASFPSRIISTLLFLELVGLLKAVSMESKTSSYRISKHQVDCDVYKTLLKTRGFGLFRRLEQTVGKDEYEKMLKEIEIKSLPGKDDIHINLVWDAYQLNDHSLARNVIPVLQGYVVSEETNYETFPFLNLYQRRGAYQVTEFMDDMRANIFKGKPKDRVESLKKALLLKLTTERLLHPDVSIGQLWILDRSDGKRKCTWFTNPYFAFGDKEKLKSHIDLHSVFSKLMQEERGDQEFSNTAFLLDVLMPELPKPCVFRYHPPESHDRSEIVTFREENDFYLIGFCPPKTNQYRNSTPISANFVSHGKFGHMKGIPTFDFGTIWESKVAEPTDSDIQKSPKACLPIISLTADKLEKALRDLPLLKKYADEEQGQCRNMAEILLFLNTLFTSEDKGVKDVLFIPACYRGFSDSEQIQQCIRAKDLLVLSYARELTISEITEEFERYNLIYDSIGFRLAQQELADWVKVHLKDHLPENLVEQVRVTLDPGLSKNPWIALLHKELWFHKPFHKPTGAKIHLKAIKNDETINSKYNNFLKNSYLFSDNDKATNSGKALFFQANEKFGDKYKISVRDMLIILNEENFQYENRNIHLPFQPAIIWLESLKELRLEIISEFQIQQNQKYFYREHNSIRPNKPKDKFACLELLFGKNLSEDQIIAMNNGIKQALCLDFKDYTSGNTGNMSRVFSGALKGWYDVFKVNGENRSELLPFFVVRNDKLLICWIIDSEAEADSRSSSLRVIIKDHLQSKKKWAECSLNPNIHVLATDSYDKTFQYIFHHLNMGSVDKAFKHLKNGIVFFSRSDKLSQSDVDIEAVNQTNKDVWYINTEATPSLLTPIINEINHGTDLEDLIESRLDYYPILNSFVKYK